MEGVDYYILVHGYSDCHGDFGLKLTTEVDEAFQPLHNDCDAAIFISGKEYGTTFIGSTTNATLDTSVTGSCGVRAAAGVWYSVMGDNLELTASTCSDETNYDTYLSVFSGDCDDLECDSYRDDSCGRQMSISWEAEEGVHYYILVHGFSDRHGDFGLTVTSD